MSEELELQERIAAALHHLQADGALDRGGLATLFRDITALLARPAPPAVAAGGKEPMKIGELVDRFLRWPLPTSVCSDTCVTDRHYPHSRWGTNLLTADEAQQMLEFVLMDSSIAPPSPGELPEGVKTLRRLTATTMDFVSAYREGDALMEACRETLDAYDLLRSQLSGALKDYRSWAFIEAALKMEQARIDKASGMFPQVAEEHRKSKTAMQDVLETVRFAKERGMPLPTIDAALIAQGGSK